MFKDSAARIEKRRHGRNKGIHPSSPSKPFQKFTTIVNGVQDRLIGLSGKARHEKEVNSFATQIQGVRDHRLQRSIVISPSKPEPDFFIMRLRRDLDIEIGHCLSDSLELRSGGGSEKLESDMVLDTPTLEGREESESIVLTRLEYVTDNNDRSIEMINTVEYILCEKMRGTKGWSLSVRYSLEKIPRSPTCLTVIGTPSAGENGRYRIGEPVEEGFIAQGVQILDDLLHDVAVVDGNVVEILRDIGEWIHLNLFIAITPAEVWDPL